MITSLFLATVLMGQIERQILVNTGPVESKFYIRAVIEDRTTEIPIINSTLPVIAVSRDGYGNLEMRLDYAYGLPYNGEKIIHYRPKPQSSTPPTRTPEPQDKIAPYKTPIFTTPSHHSDEEFLRQIQLLNEFVQKLNELIKYQIVPVPQEEKTTPIPKY